MRENRDLFGARGLRALSAALQGQPLLAFDFDGTLAPLVDRPDDARVPDALARRLARLAQLRPLAIVTGRAVADVSRRLGFPVAYVVGNHGAEEAGGIAPFDPALFDSIRRRLLAAQLFMDAAGVILEDKHFSLALHYRQAPDPIVAQALIADLLSGLPQEFGVVPGRMVCNVVHARAPDKGDAVVALTRRANCALAIFVGDDINDETVFAKAAANWLTIRVGNDYPLSKAGYFLDNYGDMGPLLDKMIGDLEMQ